MFRAKKRSGNRIMRKSMEQNEMRKRRRWWLAGLLSFFVPGLGQVYNGEATKGLFFYFVFSVWGGLVFSLFYFIMKHPLTHASIGLLLLSGFISGVVFLFIIFESIRRARRIGGDHVLKAYNRWWIYLIIILVVTGVDQCVSFSIQDNTLKAYKIPTESMQPTIKIGDHLLCNQLYYQYHNPKRGDLIIFKVPNDNNREYIKRIVGLPGDEIELKGNALFINGRKMDEPYAIYECPPNFSGFTRGNFGPYIVPEDEYFVLGDNRCNSRDSRYIGTVKRHNIQGKAIFIYFSWEKHVPRFSRIGKIL